jgi:hypothetical protein
VFRKVLLHDTINLASILRIDINKNYSEEDEDNSQLLSIKLVPRSAFEGFFAAIETKLNQMKADFINRGLFNKIQEKWDKK